MSAGSAAPGADRDALASLADSLPGPVLALDRDGRVAWLNPAAEEWFARSRRKLVGRPFNDSELGGRLSGPAFDDARREATSGARTVTCAVVAEGRWEATLAPWWHVGEVVGCVVAIAVAREGGGTDMETLAAGLAHEIRNPLAALRGAAELLQGELGPPPAGTLPPTTEYVRLILSEAGRVDALVRRMLDLARPPILSLGPVKPSQLVHDLALQAAALARQGISIDERFDPALPLLRADRDALFAALVNLVKNAVEASPEGGRIVVEAALDGERRQRVADGRLARVVRFTILDDGPGLGANESRLFTPFFTTKGTGTGLGLLLARRTIEAHGGRLMLSTRRGRPGADATVLLPLENHDG